MKVSLILAASLALAIPALAQVPQQDTTTASKKHFVHIGAGVAVVGTYSFSNNMLYDPTPRTGMGVTVGYGHLFGKKKIAGISAHGSLYLQGIDVKSVNNEGDTVLNTIGLLAQVHAPLTAGLLIDAPMQKHAITFFAEAGMVYSLVPKLNMQGAHYVIYQSNAMNVGLALAFGITPRIYVSKYVSLSPSVQYNYFRTTFKDMKKETPSSVTYHTTTEVSQMIFIAMGVTINLLPRTAAK